MLKLGPVRSNQSESSTPGVPTNGGLVLKYFLSETIHNGSRGTHFAKFLITKFLKDLGMPSFQKSAVFLNIVQKAFDPPPLLFEHLSYFAGGVF